MINTLPGPANTGKKASFYRPKPIEKCPYHSSNPLDSFCRSHYVLCCKECISDNGSEHNGCDVVPVTDRGNLTVIGENLVSDLTALEIKVNALISTKLPSLSEKQSMVDENVQSVRAEITKTFDAIRQALDAREKELLGTLETIHEAEPFDAIISKVNDCEETLSIIKAEWESVNKDETHVHPMYIIRHGCAVRAQMSLVDDIDKKASSALKNTPKVVFKSEKGIPAKIACFGDLYVLGGPQNITGKSEWWDTITLQWDGNDGENFQYEVEMRDESPSNPKKGFFNVYRGDKRTCRIENLTPETSYTFRIRREKPVERNFMELSNKFVVRTLGCSWKRCPETVGHNKEYAVSGAILNKASFTGGDDSAHSWATVTGSVSVPPNRVTSWGIKVSTSREDDGNGIFIGVAPSGIDQSKSDNVFKCGWYFDCFSSKLCSGPPHEYWYRDYGRSYVRTEDVVGVVVDTEKGVLSFALNGTDLGTAYEGIPLDKPLVPCVLLKNCNDSVELVSL